MVIIEINLLKFEVNLSLSVRYTVVMLIFPMKINPIRISGNDMLESIKIQIKFCFR
jgi:hypothetical protein